MFERDDLNADSGIYAQDRWTVNRMTINMGIRYEPLQRLGPGSKLRRQGGSCRLAASRPSTLPNWNNWAPQRAWPTTCSATGGPQSRATSASTSPANRSIRRPLTTRWRSRPSRGHGPTSIATARALDAFGNAQYDEIGPARNVNFGLNAGTTRLDPTIPRGNNWEQSVVVQHELFSNFGLSRGGYWQQNHNLTWTDNLLVDPDTDYTPFTIVVPRHLELPNGGGEVVTM